MSVTSNATAQVKEHPDVEYIKSPEIGLVIAKGFAATHKANPPNPVDYFAKWLLHQSQIKKQALEFE